MGRRKWLGTAGYRWPDLSSFLSQVVKACNEGVRKMSRTEQMISIQKKMEFKIKVSLHPSVCVRFSPVSWSVAHWPGSLNGHSGVSEQGHLPEAFPDPWLEGPCVFPSHQAITLREGGQGTHSHRLIYWLCVYSEVHDRDQPRDS